MARSTHNVECGIASSWNVQLYDGATPSQKITGVFTGSEPILCQVWPGDSQAATFTPTVSWNTGPLGIVNVAYSAAQTTTITPGYYEGRIYLADLSALLAVFDVNLTSAPGTNLAGLVTIPYVRGSLAGVAFSNAELEFLPNAIDSASDAVRQYCNRWFTRRTTTKEYVPSYDGRVRLDEPPVNQILRVAGNLTPAITITATSASQMARVYFSTTGDRVSGLTVTGLTLTRTASGTTTTNMLLFATYASVTTLVAAINALGGWTATVMDGFGLWPTSELRGGDTAQGALDDGATLSVYADDLSDYLIDWETGMLTLNRWGSSSSLTSPRWGAGWDQFANSPSYPARVQITHDLGYDVVPHVVQHAAALTAKDAIKLNAVDNTVQTEKLSEYSYSVATIVKAMSDETRQLLAPYRISNA